MSIRYNGENAVTKKTIRVLSQLPLDGASGTLTDIAAFMTLTGGGYAPSYKSNHVFYNMIRCEIPSGSSGYLLGVLSSTAAENYYVKVESNTIKWYIGSTNVASKACEDGVHDIGFVGGYAVYDNAKVNDSQSAVASRIHPRAMTVGGVTKADGTHEYYSSLKLYRFNLTTYWNASPTTSSPYRLLSYYPLKGQTRFVNARWSNPDAYLTLLAGSASAATSGATYGVQLDDLREVTGSGYRDLTAIVCEDNPNVAETWQQPADHIVKTGTSESHDMAFRMADGSGSTVDDRLGHIMPLPTGYTLSRSGQYTYNDQERGELVYGRYPKWSIWQDNLKFGFWIEDKLGELVMRYNLFRDINGNIKDIDDNTVELENAKVELARWRDYSTDPDTIHKPILQAISSVLIEMHNDMHCKCGSAQIMAGDPTKHYNDIETKPFVKDEHLVFFYEQGAHGSVSFRAGNLIPWNYARAYMQQYCYVYGVAVDAGFSYGQSDEYSILMADINPLGEPLSADNKNTQITVDGQTTTVLAYLRDTIIEKGLEVIPGRIKLIVDEWAQGNTEIRAHMALLAANKTSGTPTTSEIINCSRFVKDITTNFNLSNDPYITVNTSNYRILVADDNTIQPAILIGYHNNGNGRYDVLTKYYEEDSGDANFFSSRIILPFISNAQNAPMASDGDYIGIFELSCRYYIGERLVKRHNIAVVESKCNDTMIDSSMAAFSRTLRFWSREDTIDSSFPRYPKYKQRGNSAAVSVTKQNVAAYANYLIADYMDFQMANYIPDDSTVAVVLYKKSTAPVICELSGDWDSNTQTLVNYFGNYAIQVPNTYGLYNPDSNKIVYQGYANMFVSGGTETHRITSFSIYENNNTDPTDSLSVDFGIAGSKSYTKSGTWGDSGYSVVCTRSLNGSTVTGPMTIEVSKNGALIGTVSVTESSTEQTVDVNSTVQLRALTTVNADRNPYTIIQSINGMPSSFKLIVYKYSPDSATDPISNASYNYQKRTGVATITMSKNGSQMTGSANTYTATMQYLANAEYDGWFKGLDGGISHIGFWQVQITSNTSLEHGEHYAFALSLT